MLGETPDGDSVAPPQPPAPKRPGGADGATVGEEITPKSPDARVREERGEAAFCLYNQHKKLKYKNRNSMIKINLALQYNNIINMIEIFIVAV
jgi:hypothetical protein